MCCAALLRCRFNVEVWDELAQQVALHAPKGTQLAVTGRLFIDKCARSAAHVACLLAAV